MESIDIHLKYQLEVEDNESEVLWKSWMFISSERWNKWEILKKLLTPKYFIDGSLKESCKHPKIRIVNQWNQFRFILKSFETSTGGRRHQIGMTGKVSNEDLNWELRYFKNSFKIVNTKFLHF